MNKKQVLSLLGLCQRARRLVSGEEMSLELIKKGSAKLVFLASDAGDNTAKRVQDKSNSNQVPVTRDFTSDEISDAIGKINRKVIVIKDSGFAKKMLSLLK